jgi:hypothetical protein
MRGHGERQEVGQGRQLELGVREVLLEPLGEPVLEVDLVRGARLTHKLESTMNGRD